jgi:hypothetical protein
MGTTGELVFPVAREFAGAEDCAKRETVAASVKQPTPQMREVRRWFMGWIIAQVDENFLLREKICKYAKKRR